VQDHREPSGERDLARIATRRRSGSPAPASAIGVETEADLRHHDPEKISFSGACSAHESP
jgi:hypothetical protein